MKRLQEKSKLKRHTYWGRQNSKLGTLQTGVDEKDGEKLYSTRHTSNWRRPEGRRKASQYPALFFELAST